MSVGCFSTPINGFKRSYYVICFCSEARDRKLDRIRPSRLSTELWSGKLTAAFQTQLWAVK